MADAIGTAGMRPTPRNIPETTRISGIRAGSANFGAAPDAPPLSAGEAARLQWAAEQLESLFINQLWRSMRRTVIRSGMFDGPGVRLFEEMLDEERSRAMANAGGLGLAAMLYEQLSAHLQEEPRLDEQAKENGRTTPRLAENTETNLGPQRG